MPGTLVVIAGIPPEIVIQNNKLNSLREKEKINASKKFDGFVPSEKIHKKNVKS
jgi:hypothetical protein